MFDALNKLMTKELNRRGLGTLVTAGAVCKTFEKFLAENFSVEMLQEIKGSIAAKSFQDGTFVVAVQDGSWAKIILDQKQAIIEYINKELKQKIVKKITTKVENKIGIQS